MGFHLFIEEDDIVLINSVLKVIIDKREISIKDIITKTNGDEKLANKLFSFIELKGYADKTKYGDMLECNEYTRVVYENDSVKQFFEEEIEKSERSKKKDIETDLNIKEKDRNKFLSWGAFIISIISISISVYAILLKQL